MAQNIVLSWLAGGRVIECKTVQVKDDIEVPRPCIDMATVGYNVEWSQELTVDQSLEEYVKGSMLIEMLKATGLGAGLADTVFDMSAGYDLAGIRSAKVGAFFAGMMDATPIVERLRAQIPDAWRHFRDLPFTTRISDTLTLSTFHGCPPEEIEAIARYLLAEIGIAVVVKLNPTLLGREELASILYDRLGYTDIKVPDEAFADDANWEQIKALVERLGPQAEALGRGFGVKFSNTLVVENHKTFFPASERWMYLSSLPLHPLAIALVRRFRRAFGDRYPISFSAGVDALNFAETVGLGLKPVTVCSDLLKPAAIGAAGAISASSSLAWTRSAPRISTLSSCGRTARPRPRSPGSDCPTSEAPPAAPRWRRAATCGRRRARRFRPGCRRRGCSTPKSTPRACWPIAATAPARTPRRPTGSKARWPCSTA